MKQVKEGTLTQDEANKRLKNLGVLLPTRIDKGDKFLNLDDETKKRGYKIN